MALQNNPFLTELLQLQQDGSGAISAPSNWVKSEPLLKVETTLDELVDSLKTKLHSNLEGDVLIWSFFIGSPGNGKSAAAGLLARKLTDIGFSITDEDGVSLADIEPSNIPYLLKVYGKGSRHASIWIAQDASVVRNPYREDADPSAELLDLIDEAIDHGVSLVVCTNRGVLEKASRSSFLGKEGTSAVPGRVIRNALEINGASNKEVRLDQNKRGKNIILLSSKNLEVESLLFKVDTAKKIIEKAVDDSNWLACQDCSVKELCPFYNNKRWLASDGGQASTINLFKYAELLSGQLIVFREFLALISLILAGCPRDYGVNSPCQWVHAATKNGNLLALAARRIYMILFSAYSPSGLELQEGIREIQASFLQEILREISALEVDSPIASMMRPILNSSVDDFVSSDVGIQRLLGSGKIMSVLDVNNGPTSAQFLNEWSIGSAKISELSGEIYSKLEEEINNLFLQISSFIESSPALGSKHFFWLSRWYSSFSFRMGSLASNNFMLGQEINQLAKVIGSDDSHEKAEVLRGIQEIELTLNRLLLGDNSGVKISEYGRLKGLWVTSNLRPKINPSLTSHTLGVPVEFGKEKEILNAEGFAWLLRKANFNMSFKSFPMQHIDCVQDALVRAAGASNYSTQKDDVELEVLTPNNSSMTFKRFRGNISVE